MKVDRPKWHSFWRDSGSELFWRWSLLPSPVKKHGSTSPVKPAKGRISSLRGVKKFASRPRVWLRGGKTWYPSRKKNCPRLSKRGGRLTRRKNRKRAKQRADG